MKTNPTAQRRGVALVIVLVFVVLLSVFILSFFTNAQNELSASQSFSGEISAHQLAETASSLVQGQIREATTQDKVAWASQPGMIRTYGDGNGNASDKALAFYKLYSSDDMIVGLKEMDAFRAKINDAKLLGGEVPFDTDPKGTSGWDSQPALFTDINSPITLAEPTADGSTAVKFPIIDGSDIRLVTLPVVPAKPSEAAREVLTYDAVNERGDRTPDGLPDVEGFAIDPKTVKYTEPNEENPLSPTNTPVPMPVRWLYVLRDGSLTVPNAAKEDKSTKLLTIGEWDAAIKRRPTKDNPIVGRVAFWTDDDSCKVNINTAGGFNFRDIDRAAYNRERDFAGSYWDQPRTYTKFDYGEAKDDGRNGETGEVVVGGLSITQPIAREYQRYPGHPATTSLGLLFKDLLNSEQIYSILPRLGNRGTRGGTERLYADNSDIETDEDITEDDYSTPLPVKRDRLFASVDEFLFGRRLKDEDPFRAMNDLRLASNPSLIDRRLGGRLYNDQLKPGQSAITPELLEKMRFFLTAHSRSPELNLFGRPRITIWPSYPDENRLNASDRLLNFCSIIGPRTREDGTPVPANEVKLFQYQRSDPYSTTNDWNGQDVTPRRFKMPQTPEGGTRNQFIHGYLKKLTGEKVPGFAGGSFEQKYPDGDRDQILTQIFDYMRCVNMRDSTRDKYISPQDPKNPATPLWRQIEAYKFAPLGIVAPINITEGGKTSRGFGRFPIFSEAALVLYHTGYKHTKYWPGSNKTFKTLKKLNDELNSDDRSAGKAPANGNDPKDKTWDRKEGVTHNMIGAFLIFESFNPMMGYAPTRTLNAKSADRTRFIVEVEGMNQITLTGAEGTVVDQGRAGLQLPKKAKNMFMHSSGSVYHGRNLGGSEGWLHMLVGAWNKGASPVLDIPNKWGTISPVEGAAPPANHWYEFQSKASIAVAVPEDPENGTFLVPEDGPEYFQYLNPDQKDADGVTNSEKWQKLLLSGATLNVNIKFGEPEQVTPAAKPIWSLTLNFPQTTVPVPTDHIWMNDPGGFALDPAVDPGLLFSVADPRVNFEGVKSFGGRLFAPPLGAENNASTVLDSSAITRATPINRQGGVFGDGSANASGNKPPGFNNANRWRQLMQPGDTIRSIVLGVEGDDPRIAAINPEASALSYSPHPNYLYKPGVRVIRHAQTLRTSEGTPQFAMTGLDRTKYFAGVAVPFGKLANVNKNYPNNRWPDLPPGITGVRMDDNGKPTKTGRRPGDFDTGLGNTPDGAYTGKSDEGNPVFRVKETYTAADGSKQWYWRYPHPYFDWAYEETFDTFFTPNRQTPSAVVFGSLPIGKNAHWSTLAFSPFSALEAADPSGRELHPGRKANYVRDHLLLDLFNMPIVEPYAISEPFSTAGKVNLNYPMMPFGNIERSTAFRAALHSVRVSAFPTDHVDKYKVVAAFNEDYNYRYPVDRDLTIRAFRDFFDKFKKDSSLGLFKSASEICDRGLYPTVIPGKDAVTAPKYTGPRTNQDPDYDLKTTFWRSNAMTGDNMREKPYSDLYPRLTTKSNTYTVHIRAQSLRQTPQSATLGVWDEKKDRVIGEYRGSSTIERFIDPEDARFDPRNSSIDSRDKIDVDQQSIEPAYRFRVISTKRFVP